MTRTVRKEKALEISTSKCELVQLHYLIISVGTGGGFGGGAGGQWLLCHRYCHDATLVAASAPKHQMRQRMPGQQQTVKAADWRRYHRLAESCESRSNAQSASCFNAPRPQDIKWTVERPSTVPEKRFFE